LLISGEKLVLVKEMEKARIEAVRAREELKRCGASEEDRLRLATLEAAIDATNQELMWRQKAAEELAAVVRCAELAQVFILYPKRCLQEGQLKSTFWLAGWREPSTGQRGSRAYASRP
jgi:hypothetical protein